MTYSIIGRDPETGELGIAAQSRWFHAGQDLAWVEAGVGAVCTQSILEPTYGSLDRAPAQWSKPGAGANRADGSG